MAASGCFPRHGFSETELQRSHRAPPLVGWLKSSGRSRPALLSRCSGKHRGGNARGAVQGMLGSGTPGKNVKYERGLPISDVGGWTLQGIPDEKSFCRHFFKVNDRRIQAHLVPPAKNSEARTLFWEPPLESFPWSPPDGGKFHLCP